MRSCLACKIKIGFAGGALESVSIKFILFVCCNPNKPRQAPHVGQIGRSTARSGKETVLKSAKGHSIPVACDQGCQQRERSASLYVPGC